MLQLNLSFITEQITLVAKQAGAFIKTERTKFNRSDIEVKGQNDFVSYVDKTAERIIVGGLENLIPEAGFITEEKTINKQGLEYNWVIDPLDGTTNFIHSVPCFAVSIGLLYQEEIIAGVIYEINLDECFYAFKNGGAFCNGNKINVSPANKLKDSLLVTGFPYYDYSKLDEYMNLFRYLMQHTHGLRRLGSAATDMAYVACGRFDAFYEYSLKPWDVAAGIIIIKEAGGAICDFKGGSNFLFGQEIIASNNGIFNELSSVVNKFMN